MLLTWFNHHLSQALRKHCPIAFLTLLGILRKASASRRWQDGSSVRLMYSDGHQIQRMMISSLLKFEGMLSFHPLDQGGATVPTTFYGSGGTFLHISKVR